MPVGLAQQPLPQSASLRHCPPINCPALPLPTFFAPDGSKGGAATTTVARAKRVAIVNDFILIKESRRIEVGLKIRLEGLALKNVTKN